MPINNNGILVRPIGWGDISQALGVVSLDMGTLYNSQNVKMWSRYKPVPWSINGVAEQNPKASHPTDWWKGRNGDFGITPKSADTTNVLSFIDGYKNGWVYSRDTLAFRSFDFDGYNKYATNPFDSLFLQPDRNEVAPGGIITIQYQLSAGGAATTYNLGIIELNSGLTVGGVKKSISDLYAAFLVFQKVSGGVYTYRDWFSASENLSDLESDPAMHSVQYTVPTTTGDYRIVPVLTTVNKTSADQGISSFITIPERSVFDFTVSNTVLPYMQVSAFVDSNAPGYGTEIYFYIDFFGGSNGGSFENISLGFEVGGVSLITLNNVQHEKTSGALTVSSGQRVQKPDSTHMYSKAWSSGIMTLQNFVQNGGKARIYAPSYSTIESYEVPVYPAAALPSRTIISWDNL